MAAEGAEKIVIKEVLPKTGLVYTELATMPILCKPKILPLKSVTLEKLEKMQKDAQETIKKQEEEAKLHEKLLEQQNAMMMQSTNPAEEPDSPIVDWSRLLKKHPSSLKMLSSRQLDLASSVTPNQIKSPFFDLPIGHVG